MADELGNKVENIGKTLLDFIGLIQNPERLDILRQAIESKDDVRVRKLSTLSQPEDEQYKEKLKEILNLVNVNDVMNKLLGKLSLKIPKVTYTSHDDPEAKWKCEMNICYGGSIVVDSSATHSKKKKAQMIAYEKMILSLLTSKQYGQKVRNFIDDYIIKLGLNHSLTEDKPNSAKSFVCSSPKPHIPIEKVMKLKKREEDTSLSQKTLLSFEIFSLKWERLVILDFQYIVIENVFENIRSLLSKHFKKEKVNVLPAGSYLTDCIRSNCCTVDLIVEYSDNFNKDWLVEKTNQVLNEMSELKLRGFSAAESKIESNLYRSKEQKCIIIKSGHLPVTLNLYFHSDLSPSMKMFTAHKDWYSLIKDNLKLEDLVLIKLLKSWRRDKKLSDLKAELLEIFVTSTLDDSIGGKLLKVLHLIKEFVRNEPLKINLTESASELIKDNFEFIKMSQSHTIIYDQCTEAIRNIKEEKFYDLF